MQDKINIDNYEAFLLDLAEGRLSEADLFLLKEFAALHPELHIDLEEHDLVYLEAAAPVFEGKETLKKSLSDLVSNETFVAYIENTLTSDERKQLEDSCETNSILANELRLYQKTLLIPDNTIVFENKERIKKKAQIIWFTPIYMRTAAALLLLAGLIWIFTKNIPGEKTSQKLASVKTHVIVPEQKNTLAPDQKSSSDVPVPVKEKKLARRSSAKNNNLDINNNSVLHEQHTAKQNSKQTPSVRPTTPSEILPDSSSQTLLAFNNEPLGKTLGKTIVITETTEDEDEFEAYRKEKSDFWSKAKRTLARLNKLGVKQVNGSENNTSTSEQYVLSFGGISIEKNRYAQ